MNLEANVMTVVPDATIAVRDYLRDVGEILDILGDTTRVVLSFEAVTDTRHWVVLQESGGPVDLYTPVRHPRLTVICSGPNEWEAKRLMRAVSRALGLYDPRHGLLLQGTGVVISRIIPEGQPGRDRSKIFPGVEASVPYQFVSIVLTVTEDTL